MDLWFQFILHPKSSQQDVLEELSPWNLRHPTFLEDVGTGKKTLYAAVDKDLFSLELSHITSYTKIENPDIDWAEQWACFSPYFKNGRAKIPLSDFAPSCKKELSLLPGPGFGDLSHPTTALSLTFLAKYARGKTLIDLGCGSGILSLAALIWKAHFVYSLDIDPDAILHTQKNAAFNKVGDRISASNSLPSPLSNIPSLLIMNMTFGDQKEALKSLSFIPDLWITSGVLKEQQEAYLSWAQEKGFELQESLDQDKWVAFVFKKRRKGYFLGQSTAIVI